MSWQLTVFSLCSSSSPTFLTSLLMQTSLLPVYKWLRNRKLYICGCFQNAVSLYRRLGFAKKKGEDTLQDEYHASWQLKEKPSKTLVENNQLLILLTVPGLTNACLQRFHLPASVIAHYQRIQNSVLFIYCCTSCKALVNSNGMLNSRML